MNIKQKLLLPLFVFIIFLNGCREESLPEISDITDYSFAEHWLSLPAPTKQVDIFYLYPTAWAKTDSKQENICEIDNISMQSGAVSAFNRQATVFESTGNIYAPFYRQADAAYVLSLSDEDREKVIGDIPTADVTAAFDYYIKNFNNGRPFILAGHSQGTNVLMHLLSGYLKENPDVYERMVAAYLIGFPVTEAYLDENTHLKFAEGADDTGVIISYNTQAPDVKGGTNPVVGDAVGLVINPINWKRDETLATTGEGLGSVMPDPATMLPVAVPQYADAKIDLSQGVLICSTASEDLLYPITKVFGRGIYHSFDYPFYYFNLRENAKNRVAHFLSK